jgi:Flp pilus assembly pilin Flp
MKMLSTMRRLKRDTLGANMVEYIILVGIVALFAITAFKTFGGNVSSKVKAQAATVSGVQEGIGE